MIPPNEAVDHAMTQTTVQTGQDATVTGEPKPGTARCPCCRGTGRILVGPGSRRPTKEEAQLRSELIRVWDMAGSLEGLAADIYETAGEAISSLVADLENAGSGIAERDRLISDLERQLAVHQGWDGDAPGEEPGKKDGQPAMTRDEHRLASARFEAAKNGSDPSLITKKKRGAQSGHRGVSRRERTEGTVVFRPELCRYCGRADLVIVRIIRKRFRDLAEARRSTISLMYVIRVGQCPGCDIRTIPHTDAIPGTSLGPRTRATLQAYERAHNTEDDMAMMLREIENADVSAGAVSNCISAMADHIDGDVLAIPYEEPVILDPVDLRGYRSPVAPPSDIPDTEFHRQDALLTQRSNLWTSFQPQPAMVQIVERASMDPYVRTDETGHQVEHDGVQASVAETARTTQISIISHRDAVTLRSIWGWMEHPPAMRDGTTGYEWHQGILSRCLVHLLRDAEESSMENELGSPQYDRYQMMRALYQDTKLTCKQAEQLAGGPLRCASQLGIIARIPGLAEFIDARIDQLTERAQMIIGLFPADSVTTTLANALPHMFTAPRVPGMPASNNDTERSVRDLLAVDRRRVIFPNWRAARNFAILRTFAATCEKNGISAYQATIRMARDPTWSIFTDGIPPPIFGGGAAPKDEQAVSAEPDPA